MVTLKSVSKSYFNDGKVLDRVELHLNKGEFIYLVGGSGAGKTSLLKILATEEAPSTGSISLFGQSLQQVSPSRLRLIRQSIGYIPQNVRLIPDLSVSENIALPLLFAGKSRDLGSIKTRIGELMDQLGLTNKRDVKAGELSGGEAQRVAVARALIRNPELIIADEPTGAQDKDYTWTLMELFVKANQKGSTVVVATHDREIVRRVRKKSAVIKGGQLTVEEAHCFY